jgi:hypothetical protein
VGLPPAAGVFVAELSSIRGLERELKDVLELARDVMSHANPSGDSAPTVERALDC